jgi:hypothetical protein
MQMWLSILLTCIKAPRILDRVLPISRRPSYFFRVLRQLSNSLFHIRGIGYRAETDQIEVDITLCCRSPVCCAGTDYVVCVYRSNTGLIDIGENVCGVAGYVNGDDISGEGSDGCDGMKSLEELLLLSETFYNSPLGMPVHRFVNITGATGLDGVDEHDQGICLARIFYSRGLHRSI